MTSIWRRGALIALLICAGASPAGAQRWPAAVPSTPTLEQAEIRIRRYLETVPNLPKDVVVIPSTGVVPWPGVAPSKNIQAEVWTVIQRGVEGGRPLIMFAIRPDTGEVYVMYLSSLQSTPTFASPKPIN